MRLLVFNEYKNRIFRISKQSISKTSIIMIKICLSLLYIIDYYLDMIYFKQGF
jgi:hypothetical protein